MLVLNMNNVYFIKQNDTATEIELQIQESDGTPFDLSAATKVEIVIGTDVGRVLVKTPTLLPGVGLLSFGLDEGDLLPTGDNFVEVHIYTEAGEKHVAPSKGYYKLKVQRAIDEMQQEVTTYTLDYFLQEVRQATQSINAIVEEGTQLIADLRPMKSAIDTATVKAELAAATASQSAKDADAAELKALEAEKKANDAATNANTKATGADTAAALANNAASAANKAKTDADAAASSANTATTAATDAANRANTAAGAIEGWGTAEPWTVTKSYVKNNIVTFNGSTWQAKRGNTGKQPTEGADWTILAQRGIDGTGAVSSVNGLGPDENGNVELLVAVNKEDIGLGNVDNTSDMDKPVSTAQRAAIDAAEQAANSYTDMQVQGLAADGIPKLVSHEFLVTATTEGQQDYTFTDALFDTNNDTVLAFFDGEALNKAEYTVTKDENNAVTVRINDTEAMIGSIVRVLIFRNVPVGPDGAINAAVLQDGTITQAKLHADVLAHLATKDELENISLTPGPQGPQGETGPPGPAGSDANTEPLQRQLDNHASRLNALENGSDDVSADVSGILREVSHLKLKQAAADRIEGGVTFADDMNGSRFGFTLNEAESTNIKVRNGKMLMLKEEATNHSANNTTVVASAHSTAGNGGRKLVRLSNGWLVVSAYDSSQKRIYFYAKKSNDSEFEQLCYMDWNGAFLSRWALVSKENTVYIIHIYNAEIWSYYFNPTEVANTVLPNDPKFRIQIDRQQSAVDNVSLAIDPTNGHLHAAWASKNITYPNSFNIRYSKSTDGGATWSAVEQVTNHNTSDWDTKNPTIAIMLNGNPLIVYDAKFGSANGYYIKTHFFANGAWSGGNEGVAYGKTIYNGNAYTQSSPSAAVDKDGVIHVACHGTDSTDTGSDNIRYAKSTDGGVTWSAAKKLTIGNASPRWFASVTVDKDNKCTIVYVDSDTVKYISSSDKGENWTSPTSIGPGYSPSSLYDPTFEIPFSTPPVIYRGTSDVKFTGDWSEAVEVPQTTATAVYDIPSTNYVGAFVQKAGAVTVTATMNDAAVPAVLEGNEYELVKSFASEAPVKLKLSLSRPDTTGGENDAVTRILGGRS